jgi:hypothetical protein
MAERYGELGFSVRPGIGENSYSESEAYFAAAALLKGEFQGILNPGPTFNTALGSVQSVVEFIPSFPIPNSTPGLSPFIIDQLWLVLTPERQAIRRIAVEIQGEFHFGSTNREKDERRSAYLSSLGYEVIELDAWWCRIDPYRSILLLLQSLGLFYFDGDDFIGPSQNKISAYHCAVCGFPMSRFDQRDIVKVDRDEHQCRFIGDHAHSECINDH